MVEKKKKKRFAGGSITDEVRRATGIGGATTKQTRERFFKSQGRDIKATGKEAEEQLRISKGLKPTIQDKASTIRAEDTIRQREIEEKIEETRAGEPQEEPVKLTQKEIIEEDSKLIPQESLSLFERAQANVQERVAPEGVEARQVELSLFGHFFTASVGALGLTATSAEATTGKVIQKAFKQQDAAFKKLAAHKAPVGGQTSTSGGVGVQFNPPRALSAIERKFADSKTLAINARNLGFKTVANNQKNYNLKLSYLQKLAQTAKDPKLHLGITASLIFTSLFWAPNEKGDALTTLVIAQGQALRNKDFQSVLEIDEMIQETNEINANIPIVGFIQAEWAKFKAAAKASQVFADQAIAALSFK